LFGFSSLANAKSNFSGVYKIGEGGFGRVYKVIMHFCCYNTN
jgi:hypothetical protein